MNGNIQAVSAAFQFFLSHFIFILNTSPPPLPSLILVVFWLSILLSLVSFTQLLIASVPLLLLLSSVQVAAAFLSSWQSAFEPLHPTTPSSKINWHYRDEWEIPASARCPQSSCLLFNAVVWIHSTPRIYT